VGSARERGVSLPLLENVIPSNTIQVYRLLDRVLSCGWQRVALVGLTFKAATDDLRESPYVILARELLTHGVALAIYDATLVVGSMSGANHAYAREQIPQLDRLLRFSLEEVVADVEGVIVGSHDVASVRAATAAPIIDAGSAAVRWAN